MSPLGSRCGCMKGIPPGDCRGMLVAGIWHQIGAGSSKMAVGIPLRTAAMKLFISCGPRVEGCTAKSALKLPAIGLLGSTRTSSYCFASSLNDRPVRVGAHRLEVDSAVELGVGGEDAQLLALLLGDGANRPDQVVFHRRVLIDEHDRLLLQPALDRHVEIDVVGLEHAVAQGGDLAGFDAVGLVGQGGLLGESFGVVDLRLDLPPPAAAIASSIRNSVIRDCTYFSGTWGLTKASICTGRSTFSEWSSSTVCGDRELSFSLVASTRKL